MLSKIAGFEVRYQLFSPVFIAVFAIFFLLVFGGVTIDNIQIRFLQQQQRLKQRNKKTDWYLSI